MSLEKNVNGITSEERKLRMKLVELGVKQKDISLALGISKPDVSKVISGKSKCPRYITAVHKYLGVETPE